MRWLVVLLIVLGALAMLVGFGLILGPRGRERVAVAELGLVLIGFGVGLAVGVSLLWFAR
jgi:hypothetical protein